MSSLKTIVGYRKPLKISEIRIYANGDTYAVCPNCHRAIDKDYQSFCDNCGQRLEWSYYNKAVG